MEPNLTEIQRYGVESSKPRLSNSSSDSLSNSQERASFEEETLIEKGPLDGKYRRLRRLSTSVKCTILIFLGFVSILGIGSYALSRKPTQNKSATDKTTPQSFGGFPLKTDSFGRYIECPTDSSTSAKNVGCSFDVLLYGWLPDACFDQEMYHDLVADEADYGFYHDKEGLERIPQAELMRGEYEKYSEAYVSSEEHWQHCTYMLNSSMSLRWRDPPAFINVHLHQTHMGHCLDFVTDSRTTRSVAVNVEFPKAAFSSRLRCYLG